MVFTAAPAILAGTTLLIAAVAPIVATGSPCDAVADLFAVVGLLFLGTVALTLAGIDTGTSFGGMGASREITIAALVEPTILLAVFALSIPAGSSNLGARWSAQHLDHPGQVRVADRCARHSSRWWSSSSPRPDGCRSTTRPPTWS